MNREERRKKIEEGLALSDKMRQEEEKAKEKMDKLLEKARKDARGIIDEAQKQGKEEEKEIVEQARVEAQAIIQKGKDEAAKIRKEMEQDVRKEAIDLAIVMSKQLLSQVLSKEDQHKLVTKHIKQLGRIKA